MSSTNSSTTYHQRLAAQWSIVAIASCLAILCFLAALYRKLDLEHIGPSAYTRRDRYRHERRYLGDGFYRERMIQPKSNETIIPQQIMMKCNGHVHLCDRRINETIFATVHNAMSSIEDGTILIKNHIYSYNDALQYGYRGLNFDIGICYGRVSVIHTRCTITTQSLRSVLQSIVLFLHENPNEVLLLPTQLSKQILTNKNNITLQDIDTVFQSVPEFYNMLYDHPPPNQLQLWPTLRDLITINRRIVFFHYNGESCTKVDNATTTTVNNSSPPNDMIVNNPCPYGFHPWFQYATETEFSFRSVSDLQDTTRACRVTRGNRNNIFFGINLFITPARLLPTVKHIHQYEFIQSHINKCLLYNNRTFVHLILVNYWGVGDVINVVHDMNAALPPTAITSSEYD